LAIRQIDRHFPRLLRLLESTSPERPLSCPLRTLAGPCIAPCVCPPRAELRRRCSAGMPWIPIFAMKVDRPALIPPARQSCAENLSAQIKMGVHVTFGEFKQKTVTCRASCKEDFITHEEKQTDINIAVAMFDLSPRYDKLILLTADSDQVPAIKLARKLYPTKIFASLPPIGRKSKELRQCCHQSFKMTEEHLRDCQLPNPMPVIHEGKQYGVLVKPPSWS
jgi:hypothetical protein